MKKTLIALMALAGMASAADTQYVDFSGEGTVTSGTTIGDITLKSDMTYGNPAAWNGQFGESPVNITGGNFHAGDYTLSLWVDTASLSTTGDTLLFAYSGSTGANKYGYNGIVWNGANGTITMGRGNFTANNMAIAWADTDYSTSDALTLSESGLVNLTFAVTGASGAQTATIYVNGVEADTLASYNGNMNGGNASTEMGCYLNTNVTYGSVGLTNEKLTSAEQVISFAAPKIVPEPATATLSLLALAGLAVRRRRK
ncbi:MAG: PEP-CTERM sorting domain-containing protein [Akkermansia sp.]|nr:PEP-CTERM sorting domain-containing protein [Akkermansia sp.]